MNELEELLRQINPAALEYDQWLKVGAAIKHEGGSVELWDSWSRSDRRYRNGDCINRWQGLGNGAAPVTIATLVQYCVEQGGTPPARHSLPDGVDEYAPIPMDGFIELPQKQKQIIRKEWLEIEHLPGHDGKTPCQQLTEYLRALFSQDEYVGYVATAFQTEPDAEGKTKWTPSGHGIYKQTAGELIQLLGMSPNDIGAVIGDVEEHGAWIRFNPLDGQGVSDRNVTDHRFALVECDEIAIDTQYSIYKQLELPIAAMVHSGGKSLHAIVRIDAPDYKEYQKRVDTLYDICKKNGLVIDRKNRNPSRLSRMPGVMRGSQQQRLIGTNMGKSSWAEWIDWIAALDDDLPEIEAMPADLNELPPLKECLIEGVLRKGHKMLISGPSKAGKSFLLLQLVLAIAQGDKWLGWQCRQGRVLYVNLELDRASCLHRIKDICDTHKIQRINTENIDIWNLRGKSMPMTEFAPRLIRRAMKRNYAAIIIDPIYKVITGDENSADQMAKFCNQFDRVCNELNCTVIYCHHHSKGDQGQKRAQDRASGSGVFARDPDALIDMVELELDDACRDEIQYQCQVKRLQEELTARHIHWMDDLDPDEAGNLEKIIAYSRERVPGIDAVNNDEIRRSNAMTGWRIGGILREFPAFKPVNAFFRYPVHLADDFADTMLCDRHAAGEQPVRRQQARKAAQNAHNDDLHENTVNTTVLIFDAVQRDGAAHIADLCQQYEQTEGKKIVRNNMVRRLRSAGYEPFKKGLWRLKE